MCSSQIVVCITSEIKVSLSLSPPFLYLYINSDKAAMHYYVLRVYRSERQDCITMEPPLLSFPSLGGQWNYMTASRVGTYAQLSIPLCSSPLLSLSVKHSSVYVTYQDAPSPTSPGWTSTDTPLLGYVSSWRAVCDLCYVDLRPLSEPV